MKGAKQFDALAARGGQRVYFQGCCKLRGVVLSLGRGRGKAGAKRAGGTSAG